MIEIHSTARVSPLAEIEDSVRGTRIVVGEAAIIDAFVKIKPTGGTGDVIIGPRCIINSGCVLYSGNGIQLGEGVAVAANCTFAPVNHEYQRRDVPIREQGFRASLGGVVVGDGAWIGANCVLLDGSVVGEGCVIAAGSIVGGALTAFGIYAGNPLVKLGERE